MYAMTETVQRKTWKNKALYSKGYGKKKTFQIGGLKQLFKKRYTTKYYTKVRKGLCV